MPVTKENAARYPEDWDDIALAVKIAAGWRCEGSPAYPNCRAVNAVAHPETGSIVVLTVAHLDHQPEHCERANLRAWCQRCHVTYDADHHARTAATTKAKQRRAAGQQTLMEIFPHV